MLRVKFQKGQQKKFIQEVLNKTNCPSLKELINRGIEVNYSTLKNYFSEARLMSEEFFKELTNFSGLEVSAFSFELVEGNWGQVKGGKKSKRS